jgi:adenylate cyclase class IV
VGYKDREVEIKLLVTSHDCLYGSVNRHIRKFVAEIFPEYEEISGNSFDLYWKTSEHAMADFVRLRRNRSGACVTMKSTDRGDNVDRVEVDLSVDSFKQAHSVLSGIFPEAPTKVKKKYNVYFLENEDTTISVYAVDGDKANNVFVEVEARTLTRVKDLVKQLVEKTEWEYAWSKSSLFNIFVQEQKIKLARVEEFLEA